MSRKIRVTVIRGIDFHTRTLTAPSPYVVLKVGTEKKETKPIYHEHNPAYQESFILDVNDPTIGVLTVEARSHGIENHLIGEGQIPINNLLKDETKRQIVQLTPRGQVEIELFAEDFGYQLPGVNAPGIPVAVPGAAPPVVPYGLPPGVNPTPYGTSGYATPPPVPAYGAPGYGTPPGYGAPGYGTPPPGYGAPGYYPPPGYESYPPPPPGYGGGYGY